MSALGQKRTLHPPSVMSALLPKADIAGHDRDVRFVPVSLFDNLVRLRRKTWRYFDAERLGGLEVDNEFKLG
jgi:hypothetical protein